MVILLLMLLVVYIITIVLEIKVDNERDELIEETLDFNKRLTDERNKIIKILIKAETTEEDITKTLDKIKKELDVRKTY